MRSSQPVLLWGQFLKLAEDDGVRLGTSELEALTEEGERIENRFLIRYEGSRLYSIEIPDYEPDQRINPYRIRQIVNRLRLPLARYYHYT